MQIQLSGADTCRFQHSLGGDGLGCVGILVIEVYDLGDAALDDRLGTLVTGEEVYIEPGAFQRLAVCVEDRVELSVNDIFVFGIVAGALP